MALLPEVPVDALRRTCDPTTFDFNSTEEVEPLQGIIGQERAVRAMEFGLQVEKPGYNIFITGLTGTGKMSYARSIVTQVAAQRPTPDDWCYVYNFRDPAQPRVLCLPCGKGYGLSQDLAELIEELQVEIPRAFGSDDYEKQKNDIIREFQDRSTQLVEELTQRAAALGFSIRRTSTGFVTVPVIDGKPLSSEEYEALPVEVKEEIDRKSTTVQFDVRETVRRVQQAEREAREKIKKLDAQVGLFCAGHRIDALREKYQEYPQVLEYLEALKQDILNNLELFRGEEEEHGSPPWARHSRSSALQKYKVNLFIDRRNCCGAPVIAETNPTYYNLVGRIEHENEWGFLSTNFLMIRPGAMHRANGGFLILQARDVLVNPFSWEALKRVLKTGQLTIENMGEQYGLIPLASLKPEPIPISLKVVLIGNPLLYHLLYEYDEDFRKLFKIRVDFDTEMERSRENVRKLAQFISFHCRQQNLRHFDRGAVAKVVEYSSRLAEDQEKLSTRFNELVEILYEADAWAALDGARYVEARHVQQAIEEKHYRSNRVEEKIQEMFGRGELLVDTDGRVIGQVNGLSLVDLGDYVFGRPSRITAATGLGQRGVVHIERETKMSGNIHSKGVLILSGYLAAKYAQEVPLNLSASLCFEQLYTGVDGDSASSAELYALLSSLAEVPLDQGIAVTGSINQKGEIQPVGGVTAKIEGFFRVCRLKGLTGRQGVIIPYQNVHNLMLAEEVVEACRQGLFHIYPVRTVDEGLAILTGMEPGERLPEGGYAPGTVHYRVLEKLKTYHKKLQAKEKGEEAEGETEKEVAAAQ
ncbi:MAG: AAA family ATPase [Clostridia bacterium]|nr:AAA family ATPase [Clostridia bacterium]